MNDGVKRKIEAEARKYISIDGSLQYATLFIKGAKFCYELASEEIERLTHLSDGRWHKIQSIQSELSEQCRINGIGAERELKLMAENARLKEKLRAALKDASEGCCVGCCVGCTRIQTSRNDYCRN